MKLEVVQGSDVDEWCVALNGAYVIGFAGPDAHQRAEAHKDELAILLKSLRGETNKDRRDEFRG